MSRMCVPATRPLPEGAYVELVRSIFATLLPTTIMGILVVVTARHVVVRTGDPALVALAVVGTALSILRVAMLLAYERGLSKAGLDRSTARGAERRYAAAYLDFAAGLGAVCARVFQVADGASQLPAVALLVGYAVGIAAGTSLRPWIALPSVALAVVPTAAVALASIELRLRSPA